MWIVRLTKKRSLFFLDFLVSLLTFRSFTTEYGVKLAYSTPYHHAVARDNVAGKQEPEMMANWVEHVKNLRQVKNSQGIIMTTIVYDVGGFNGIYGLTAAKLSPNSSVTIFEPDPVNAKHIRRNIRINHLDNVRIYEHALTDFKGTQEFSARGTTASRLGEGATSVYCDTLDHCLSPELIKIDAAGAESRIIRGGMVCLQSKPIIFLQTDDIDTEHEEMWRKLDSLGYRKTFREEIPSGERCILELK